MKRPVLTLCAHLFVALCSISCGAPDPDALINLATDPAYADTLAQMRQQLANEMYRTNDFMLENFESEFGIVGSE